MTDIPALISADVGILLGSDTLVQQVALAAGKSAKCGRVLQQASTLQPFFVGGALFTTT